MRFTAQLSNAISARRLAAAACLLTCTFMSGPGAASALGQDASSYGSLLIRPVRTKASDLEVTGMLAGLDAGTIGYLRYQDLRALPQTTIHVHNDENFPASRSPAGVLVEGVPLAELAAALHVDPGSDLLDTPCADKYRSHFSAGYIARHHPLLGLTIEHQAVAAWAARTHQPDPGPYFITHTRFLPAQHFLSYQEQPQVPTNIARLDYSTVAATYGAIAPALSFLNVPDVQKGFTIVRQECLRCHFQGAIGGTKSGHPWSELSMLARKRPAWFARYVRDPRAVDPASRMPPMSWADGPTIRLVVAYFRAWNPPAASSQQERAR